MNNSDRKMIFYNRLDKLLSDDLSDSKYMIKEDNYVYNKFIIIKDEYKWYFHYEGFPFFVITVQLKCGSPLDRKNFFHKHIHVFNNRFFEVFNFLKKIKKNRRK